MLPVERLQRMLINGGLFVLLALVVIAIPVIYVSSEHYFYYWDLANYQNMANAKAIAFRKSSFWAMYGVVQSIGNDYNEIFTIPLVPFILAFGESRQVYVTTVALVYLLPFALAIGAISIKLIPSHRHAVFWSTALLTLMTPVVWAPTLRGWPDAGAALLIALALWVYLQDMGMKRWWWQTVLIGFLIAAAALFRRHFGYAGVAFFISMSLQALINFSVRVRQHRREAIRNLCECVVRICLVGASTVVTLAVLGWPFLYNIVTRDYSVHASYERAFSANLLFYASQYGWGSWALAGVGLTVGIYTRVLVRPVAVFIIVFTSISLVQWGFGVRLLGAQFSLHFAPFVVLGLTAAGYVVWDRFDGLKRVLALSAVAVFLLSNTANGLAPADNLKPNVIRPLFSATFSPLIRSDYEEIVRLIQYLRRLASAKEPIYVAASSYAFNWDLLRNAERTLYGRDLAVLNILPTPEVDSRDGYPLGRLIQAHYVIVATPFQHHLRSNDQDLVRVVVFAFKDNWEIAHDFTHLPERFSLANGATVEVYKRTRETSLEAALRTLNSMQTFIESGPGDKIEWIMLSHASGSFVGRNQDKSYLIWLRPTYSVGGKPTLFVYMGMLPEKTKISGRFDFHDDQCVGASVAFSMMDRQHKVMDTSEIVKQRKDSGEFGLSFQTKDAAYLLLKISSRGRSDSRDCSIIIKQLKISSG